MSIPPFLRPGEKLAAITLDLETDYGDRVGGAFNLRHRRAEIAELAGLLAARGAPLSLFIRTDLLADYPETEWIVARLGADRHCHSHRHDTRTFDGAYEIPTCHQAFARFFGEEPLGYRAPQGVLYPGDVARIMAAGFRVSSSVFPSVRPGKVNNLACPLTPHRHPEGLWELPFAALPGLRYVVSLSYLKLLGWGPNRLLMALCGLPEVLVFDSHLHDYIFCQESHAQLPAKLKLAWGIRRGHGLDYAARFLDLLAGRGYRFVTMSELYRRCAGEPA